MNNVNQVVLSGRLTADPRVRDANNSRVAVMRIASNRSYKKGEEWVEEATFIDCEGWNKLADIIGTFKKGTEVFVTGQLASDDWEKDGEKRSKTKVKISAVEQIIGSRKSAGEFATSSRIAKASKSTEEDYTLEIPF